MPAATRTPASLGAPDEEEDHLQTVTLRRECAIKRQNQMLLERLWVLWYIVWARLLKPLWGAALQILALLEFSIEATLPLPNEATKPPICQQPEQTQAPTRVGGSLELLLGKAPWCATGQMGLMSARTYEGQMPIGEVHSCPPDLPNPQMQGSIIWEPAFAAPKARVCAHQAQRPLLDMGAHTCPDLWPSLGVIIVNPDTCIRSASQLEGEQNFHLPCVGSKLHAAPSPPQIFPSSFSPFLPSDILVRKNPSHGEGTATEWHAIKDHPHPEPQKLPNPQAENLQEAGGALSALGNVPVILGGLDPLGLAGTVMNVDANEAKPPGFDTYEQGGALPVVGTTPALAEGITGIKPASKAEKAIVARPKALVPWAQDKARRRHEVDAQPYKTLPQKGKRNTEALPQEVQ